RRGRPRTRPKELVADKAYDSRSFRIWLRRRGIKPTIATIQRKSRKRRRGRPIRVGEGYRRRWTIERCFGWMNNYRRLVVRYARYLLIYRAFSLIALIIWCVNRISKYLLILQLQIVDLLHILSTERERFGRNSIDA